MQVATYPITSVSPRSESTPTYDSEPETSSLCTALSALEYAITHVFFPPQPPDNDYTPENDLSLAHAACAAAHAYTSHVSGTSEGDRWHHITKMLDNLASAQSSRLDKDRIISQLRGMQTGDILSFFIRRQNAAVIFTKQENRTLCESFEVSPSQSAVQSTPGSLICSYPGPGLAVETQNEVFDDEDFQFELATFLYRLDAQPVDDDGEPQSEPTSFLLPDLQTVHPYSSPPPAHPQYITTLFTGILRGVGHVVNVSRVTKRIRHYVDDDDHHWRRSSFWLLIRVTIQMSVDRSSFGRACYKKFMLYFICALSMDDNNVNLPRDLLLLMSPKILRRLNKLGSSTPDWLSEMALKTCACLGEILDSKWEQLNTRPSSFQNPSQDDLVRDTQLSFPVSGEYIRNALANPASDILTTPFHPYHSHYGTIDDFLSSNGLFFDEAYHTHPEVTLLHVERLVEQGIDDWFASVTDVEDACVQLEILMDKYMGNAAWHYSHQPEDASVGLLTGIELFIALDKLVIKEIPMLADYSPEIPLIFLKRMLLRQKTSLHRLFCAFQYLSARHSHSCPGWSVFSNEFTEDSFPVRYYDQSPHLQQLKVRIEEDAMKQVVEHAGLSPPESPTVSKSPLSVLSLDAKVVVFELQCPPHVRIWRSAVSRILYPPLRGQPRRSAIGPGRMSIQHLLAQDIALKPYFVKRQGPRLLTEFHLAYFSFGGPFAKSTDRSEIRYVVRRYSHDLRYRDVGVWSQWRGDGAFSLKYDLPDRHQAWTSYVGSTSHTSNDILSEQIDCPPGTDLSRDEFIAFAHLRSGGSLQWLNILQGLRSRTLNLRRHQVHFLLSQAIFQVGPLDLNTGIWVWHQELRDSSFCNALLGELENLFMDVGSGSIDGTLMNSISLLLTRVLVSSPGEDVSERAITLLQSVRRKTFHWVRELSYDLAKAPTHDGRKNLLREMAAICRSTFNVDPAILPKLLRSAEDVDALLSCALFIEALSLPFRPTNYRHDSECYARLLLCRDRRLSVALENTLRDVILADASDCGIDLAVARIFLYHRPGTRRWEELQHLEGCWLVCESRAAENEYIRRVHINLHDGLLLVDDRPRYTLPYGVRNHPRFEELFNDPAFNVIKSDLPEMDFATLVMSSEHEVRLSLRGDDLILRAQGNQKTDILELVPSEILRKDLPPMLIDGHIHWLNVSTSIIEIRPFEQVWEESSDHWRIDCASEKYCVYKGHETLVDVHSPTWTMISRCFEDFNIKTHSPAHEDLPSNFLITTSEFLVDPHEPVPVLRLSVALPPYSLSFFANEHGELESHDIKGMVYDENQCIEALFGLKSCFVLRPKTHLAGSLIPEALIHRRIFITGGDPKEAENNQLSILLSSNDVLYHAYDVDTDLGCLIGNGSSSSTHFLAHLHAMTNWHRPDPLTGKTGVLAALCLLQSATCRSIMKLKAIEGGPSVNLFSYPHLHDASREIRNRYYWYHDTHVPSALEKSAVRRATQILPLDSVQQSSSVDMDYSTPESEADLEDIISAAASAVYRCPISAFPIDTIISNWTELWKNDTRVDAASFIPHDEPEAHVHSDSMQTLNNILGGLKRGTTRSRFQLLFLLPTMAYCSPSHQTAFLSLLIVFAMQMKSHLVNPQIHADFNVFDGYRPTEAVLRGHIDRFCVKERWEYFYREACRVNEAVKCLLQSWPCDTPPAVALDPDYWDVTGLAVGLQQLFSSCYRNFELKEHLIRTLKAPRPHTVSHPASELLPYILNERLHPQITFDQLLSERAAPELPSRSTFVRDSRQRGKTSEPSNIAPELGQLFSSLQATSAFQREYLALYETSAYMRGYSRITHGAEGTRDRFNALRRHYAECRTNCMSALGILKKSLGPTTDLGRTLEQFGQWPPITADVLLRYLASTSPVSISGRWKKCLISFAQLLLELQRARRLLRFALYGLEEEFAKELENEQCDGWNPEEYPDWLLIQVQGNFLIRRAQAETALQLISPQSGENTVMQVNMGEGKSSVIIPIAAAVLADGKQLVRVIVPRALTVQMFDLLVARLGGLVNRPIYHLPFSRTPEYDTSDNVTSLQIDDLHKLMSQCMAERGILLVRPEHVVSLKLMSVEKRIHAGKRISDTSTKHQKLSYTDIKTALLLQSLPEDSFVGSMFRRLSPSPNHQTVTKDATQDDQHDEYRRDAHAGEVDDAAKWVDLQRWLHSHVRDILDESDEILHSRFQLIYTIGLEQHMDGYPDRWTITQQVLRVLKEYARALSRNHPNSIEYEIGPPGAFPHFRIVRASDVGQRLISSVLEGVMAGRLTNLKFHLLPSALRDAIRSFISDENPLPDTAKMVEEYADQNHLRSELLLLRGLLATNILLFTLAEQRWRVDYGLADLRTTVHDGHSHGSASTMLAVPYRAKDVPAHNTQFGHPDLTIILTCLSYYYAALSEEQLRVSFEILLDQDDPSAEYALWIADCESMPGPLQTLSDINLRSSEQWDKVIFPLFAWNQATIDFYLAWVVFPKEAKEFPWKLCGSNWDLGEKREKVITGFSGTSDSRWLLPMSVTQHDLDYQRVTNASVLTSLLQPENDAYIVIHGDGQRQTTLEFLQVLTTQWPKIRVLLDVGAQILDLSNHQVAEVWLYMAHGVSGAVYFNENDELTVLTRTGITQLLSTSPFSQQLDCCVVYLDHAHTRGTDLKFSIGSRAAVTLGPKVTKDALVQGCMRMRKLGHGHSVMFFAPLGVDKSIRAAAGKSNSNIQVTTVDILRWAIHETWTDIQQRAPYWAQQGMNHKRRYEAWSRFCKNELSPEELSDAWLQSDIKSLADLYAPCETAKGAKSTMLALDPEIRQRCKRLGVLSLPDAKMDEEQEREVHREREREREVELPPRARPLEHFLHPDIVGFVKTGFIPPLHSGSAFLPIFTTLGKSSAATREADVWSPFILATVDFCRTIDPESTEGTMDQYLRPVQWVLSRQKGRDQVLVILSPFEADRLMPDIRASEYVHLHLYAPRTSQRMKPSDDLRLYSNPPLPSDWIPPWDLIDQLNVFAGQLYLRDYESYLRLCRFLGVPTKEVSNDTEIRRNLFNIPGSFEEMEITFSGSPLPSVAALLAIRNRGRPFAHTHMGRILQGQLLTKKDFERFSA